MNNKKQEKEIIRRIYNVIPVGTLHMQELLSILEIKLTHDEKITKSACLTCEITPTLILNIDFIEEYCKTDEHLFMLIMHELYHKILGHTTLFGKTTIIENIAFDAVINAILCSEFSSEVYTSFFKNLNRSDRMPDCLLRPMDKDTPEEGKELLRKLYSSSYCGQTYYDIFELLKNELINLCIGDGIILIGNHSGLEKSNSENFSLNGDGDEIKNKLMKEIIEKIIEKWPRPPKILPGRDSGGDKIFDMFSLEKNRKMKKNLKKLLRNANIDCDNSEVLKRYMELDDYRGETFIPNFKDRQFFVKNKFLDDVIIYNTNSQIDKLRDDKKVKAKVYLDVSGSVYNDLSKVLSVLNKPVKNKTIELYQFSTEVYPVKISDFENGKIDTTLGTDVNAIFNHYFAMCKKKYNDKIVILTDGYVGDVDYDYKKKIKEMHIEIYVGLFGNYYLDNLQDVAKLMLAI